MLYTFSQGDFPANQLTAYLQQANEQDVVVFWQDGVLLALKYPQIVQQCAAPCYLLENDLQARGLLDLLPETQKEQAISIKFFVELSEKYFPQLAL